MKHSFKTLLTLALALVAGNAWGATGTYSLVTDASSLSSGDVIVLGCAAQGKAAGAMGSNSYLNSVDATISNGTLTSANAIEITLGGSAGAWTLTTSEGQLTTSVAKAFKIGEGTQKTCTIAVTPAGVATITFGSYGDVQYNKSSPRFVNYTSAQTAIEIYKKGTTPTKTLESIAISGTPSKTTYEVGDSFDPAGLVVTGTYSDATTDDLTENAVWTITPATFTATTETSVSVTAQVGTVTSPAYNVTGLTVNEHVVTPGTYTFGTDWNSVFGTSHDGSFSAQANDLRMEGEVGDITMVVTNGTSTNGYMKTGDFRLYNGYTMTISVPTGYDITSITATKGGKTIAGITADCGSLTVAADVSSMEWAGASNTVVFSISATTGFSSLSVTFAVPSKILTSVAVSGTPTKTSYQEGDEFDPAGLVVTGTYDDASTDDTMASQATWSCTPATLTESTTSVTVTATVNGITSEAYVVNGITVEPFVQTYANTYTSNVELSTEGGTSASNAKVVIDETQYEAIKAGTGSAKGACVVTVPADTKTLHFHAAGWKGETVTLNVNGTSYSLTSDAGVSSTSPFTLANDPETEDYFTFTPNGATTITFTATSGNRFVLFGVNAEQGSQSKSYDATITSAGYATLYLDFAAAIPTGVTAYTAVAGEDAVTLTEVEDVIPANTAVVLEGAAGTYTFDEATTTAAAPANDLKGTLVATDWETINNGQYIYVLGQKDGVVGFYKLSETGSIKANSAYLALDKDPASGSIVIRKGDATAISLVQENLGEAVIYDLLGRRVSEPMRGIYIVNGKKMFIK